MVENKGRRKNGDKKERSEIKEKGRKREKIKEKEDKNRVDVRNRDMIGQDTSPKGRITREKTSVLLKKLLDKRKFVR